MSFGTAIHNEVTIVTENKMENIEIRMVRPDDAEFLYQLMNDHRIMRALNEIPSSLNDWSEAIACWEKDGDELDYIVCNGAGQTGWFAFNGVQSADKTAYLKMAAILPEYQHMGIGTYVLSHLLRVMKNKGFIRIILFTNKGNIYAQRTYQKCGFKITENLSQKMPDGTFAHRYKVEYEL